MSKLREFSSASGIREFLLIGGAAVDPLLRDDAQISDWDIAIVDDAFDATAIVRALEHAGFTVVAPREYRMTLEQTATCFPARHPQIGTFDVAIVGNMEFLGPFDIESLYVKFPAGYAVDNHDAISGLHAKRATLIRPIESECPAMLAKRLFVLAAKYELRFGPGSPNATTAELIRERFARDGSAPTPLHDQAACLAKFLRGLQRSAQPDAFLVDALDSGLLSCAVPPLHGVASSAAFAAMLNGDTRPDPDTLISGIRRLDRYERCAKVLNALKERVWDQSGPTGPPRD